MKYTFTFDNDRERKFREVLNRLDESEYSIIQDVTLLPEVVPNKPPQKQAIISMDPESCLTFRLGMREINIRRERTDEELIEEKALIDSNKITIKVIVPKDEE